MMDYKQSGVDIDAGNEVVRRIRSLARSTFTTGVLSDIGSFGGLFACRAAPGSATSVLVSSADGVGTKLRVAFMTGVHTTIGVDLVNHCVNDILVQGAQPLFFLDYLATGRLDPDVAVQVVEGLASACRANGCALLGGETAEMPGFYADGEYDVAGFIVGAVRARSADRRTQHPRRRRAHRPAVVWPAHQRLFAGATDRVRDRRPEARAHVPELGTSVGRRCSSRIAAICRRSGRCSAAAASRGWRTSRAAGSPRTCRGCCRRALTRESTGAPGRCPPIFAWLQRTGERAGRRHVAHVQHGHRADPGLRARRRARSARRRCARGGESGAVADWCGGCRAARA